MQTHPEAPPQQHHNHMTQEEHMEKFMAQQKKVDEAMVSIQYNLLECKPEETKEKAALHTNLGSLMFNGKGQTQDALAHYNLGLMHDPTNTKILFSRLKVFMEEQRFEEALEDAEEILRIDPDFLKPNFETQVMAKIKKALRKSTMKKVPITILTGFLGSGKTTLLNRILKENHGMKIAVIENEFGAVGIDDKLVEEKKHQEEQIIEVMNGCICCTVRKDLADTLISMKEKYVESGKIDYILIETTGMADPAPILQTFLLNEEVKEWTTIDSCITVCDGSQIVQRMEEEREEGCENEAIEQVCFADKILLNKIDICTREQLDQAKEKIRERNTQAQIDEVQLNDEQIPFDKVLNLKAFSIERALEIDQEILKGVSHHKHDSRIGTFSYKMDSEVTQEGANKFFMEVLKEKGANIYRMKGFLAIQGSPMKFVFHSVGMIMSCVPLSQWGPDEKRECVFVIIGKHLEQKWLEDRFRSAAVKDVKVETVTKEHHHHHDDHDKKNK